MIMVIIFCGKACDRPHILGWASVRARGAVLTRDTHPKIYTVYVYPHCVFAKIYTVYIRTVYLPRYTLCISPLCICQDIHSVHPHYTTIHTQHCLKLKVICCVHVILMYTLCNAIPMCSVRGDGRVGSHTASARCAAVINSALWSPSFTSASDQSVLIDRGRILEIVRARWISQY